MPGDGTHEHPTQALLDAFTMRRHFRALEPAGDFRGKTVAIVGDVTHSRVARSNVLLLQTLGAQGDPGRAADTDAVRRGQLAGRRVHRLGSRCCRPSTR